MLLAAMLIYPPGIVGTAAMVGIGKKGASSLVSSSDREVAAAPCK